MRLGHRVGLVAVALLVLATPRLLAAPAQGSISGFVFHDLNGNGAADPGEPGLVGWTASATDGITTDTAATDATGHFTITNVTSGTWMVSVAPPAGWLQTTPAPPGILVGTSGDSPAGSFGFALLPEAPALDRTGAATLMLLLLAGGVVFLRRSPRRWPG